jgi:hypothetical protein
MRIELANRIILRMSVTSCIARFVYRTTMTGVMHYARYDGGVSLFVDEANGVSSESVLLGRGVSGDTLISSVRRCLAHALYVSHQGSVCRMYLALRCLSGAPLS